MMVRPTILAAILAGGLLAACSTQAAEGSSSASQPAAEATNAVHPESGLEVIPLTITQDGVVNNFKVEVARSSQEWSRGLMFRKEMAPDEGMIFVGREGQQTSFWMRNTVIPLDIIFIGTDNRILNYYPDAEPYSEESRPSFGLTNAVLELNGGRLEELGIKEGALVEWQD